MGPRRATMVSVAAATAAALALLAPSLAQACTVCARHQNTDLSVYAVIAAFIFVPYAVVSVALRVIRNVEKSEKDAA